MGVGRVFQGEYTLLARVEACGCFIYIKKNSKNLSGRVLTEERELIA